jgi:hypothetical protein
MVIVSRIFFGKMEFPIHLLRRGAVDEADHRPDGGGTLKVGVIEELDAVWLIRRRIAEADTITATNAVISFMEKTTSNMSFVLSVKKSFATD